MTNIALEHRVGCDVVHIPSFERSLERTPTMRERWFTASERGDRPLQSLAGLYAAKEAILKAVDGHLAELTSIELSHSDTGRPQITSATLIKLQESYSVSSIDISISHDGDYAFAVAVVSS